jgi:hypothetical protein
MDCPVVSVRKVCYKTQSQFGKANHSKRIQLRRYSRYHVIGIRTSPYHIPCNYIIPTSMSRQFWYQREPLTMRFG